MMIPLDSLMRLNRSRAIVAMVVVGVVVALSDASASAGVILPWVDQSASIAVDFGGEGCGASGDVEFPGSHESAPPDRDESPTRDAIVADLLGTGGGASAPSSSASGQTSLLLAAMFQVPVVVPLIACVSRRLRERSLQLPRPPLGELLDPPKACA